MLIPGNQIFSSMCDMYILMVWIFQAQKIAEHRRKYERKQKERLVNERKEHLKKAKEENERAQRVSWNTNKCHVQASVDQSVQSDEDDRGL